MKDYVSEFQKKIAEIKADCENIHIINAGIMDHGKSSLFNSLIDKNIFEVKDIRTTVKNQKENWCDNVFLIDTPGLEAEKSDDTAAYDAYRRANMIIFVHNLNVGELHEKELAAINKIKNLFNNDEFFCKHFCLTLTFKESEEDENITAIRQKSLADIKTHCDISDFPVFIVSNSAYQKGIAENKKNLVSQSGIPELKDFLQKNFSTWNNENVYFCAMRIANEKKDLIAELQQERAKIQPRINSKTEDIKNRQQSFLQRVQAAVNQRRSEQKSADDFAQSKKYELDSLWQEYLRLDRLADKAREAIDEAWDRYWRSH